MTTTHGATSGGVALNKSAIRLWLSGAHPRVQSSRIDELFAGLLHGRVHRNCDVDERALYVLSAAEGRSGSRERRAKPGADPRSPLMLFHRRSLASFGALIENVGFRTMV